MGSFGQISTPCPENPLEICSGELPFRTFVMLIGLTVHLLVSGMTHLLFVKFSLGLNLDFLKCYYRGKGGEVMMSSTHLMNKSPDMKGMTMKELDADLAKKCRVWS